MEDDNKEVLEELLWQFHNREYWADANRSHQREWKDCPDWDCQRYRKVIDDVLDKAWKYEDLQK